MTKWIRFRHEERTGFGVLTGSAIAVHEGDMFDAPRATGDTLSLDDVEIEPPSVPTKMIALWNNFHALARKLELPEPREPLYFFKGANSFLASGQVIRRPKSYDGRVVYEGELGIVIGRACKEVGPDEADAHIFGYTCVNDVTAFDLIAKDPTFPQWARAKSFDTFGVFGPTVATGLDPDALTVRTVLNGEERQNYSAGDMIFNPRQLVSLLSHDMTLRAGDVICCGTSLGTGSMKLPESSVEVVIDGIGTLSNAFVQ